MAHLYQFTPKDTSYARRNWRGTPEEYYHALETTSTVYVGNLSFFTREEQIWELFSMVGEIKRVVMGLNKNELTPCGFCFVEYYTHEAAEACVNSISGTKLDERIIRADWDTGFIEGRQYGRGSTGGQVRDEFRDYYDPERGDRQRGPKGPPELPRPSSSHNNFDPSGSPRHMTQSPARDFSRDQRAMSPGRGPSASPAERDHRDDRGGRFDSRDHRDNRDYRDRMDVDQRHGRYDDRQQRKGNRYDDPHRDGGHGRYQDNRYKRGREDEERFYNRESESMVDEFGRDLPPTKKAKPSEQGR